MGNCLNLGGDPSRNSQLVNEFLFLQTRVSAYVRWLELLEKRIEILESMYFHIEEYKMRRDKIVQLQRAQIEGMADRIGIAEFMPIAIATLLVERDVELVQVRYILENMIRRSQKAEIKSIWLYYRQIELSMVIRSLRRG